VRKKLLNLIVFLFFSTSLFANIKDVYVQLEEDPKVLYDGNSIILKGFEGNGRIDIYSIIGNKIKGTETIDLSRAIIPIDLVGGNMYIIQVNSLTNRIKTYKIIAQ